MRIMILANHDVGLYQFRKELIAELLKKNDVTISVPYGELVEPLKDMGCKFIDTPVDRRGINPKTDFKLLMNYISLFRKEKPEMVITYTIKPNIYGGLACELCKIPYAVNITGLGTAFENDGMLKKIVVSMYKVALKRAKTVFFENSENRRIFVKEHIVKKKQACLLNGAGVNLEHYVVEEYPIEVVTKFLFMGRVMKEKGIVELFSAMDRLYKENPNIQLDVLGGFEEDYEQVIKKYEKTGWLHYHGYQKDVRPFIAKCHCFVLPSYHEGMANTNLESAASGRPVITSNIPGCKEAVKDNVSGYLCECQNVDSLYGCLKKFIQLSHEEQKMMGLAGRERMEQYFDKKSVVVKTIEQLEV